MNLVMVSCIYTAVYEFVNEFMYIHSALHMSSVMCAGGCFWLKPVAMILFMYCNALSIEFLL